MPDRTPYDIGGLLEDIKEAQQATHLEAQAANLEAQKANVAAQQTAAELKRLNGSVARLTQHVEGTEADRDAGLLAKTRDLRSRVFTLEASKGEAHAVASSRRWLIATSLAMLTAVAALIGVLVQVVRVMG